MKKLFLSLILTIATIPAMAQHYHGHHGHRPHYRPGHGWVTPMILGGVVTYVLTRPDPVVIQQPPVIVQPNPTVIQNPNCTPWTETQNSDGTITRTRTCTQ